MSSDLPDSVDSRPVAIAALVRRSDGRYLLVRRAPGLPAAGYWTTVTGRPLPGEPLEETVAREVREEVGLDVRVGALVHRSETANGSYQLVWLEAEPENAARACEPLTFQIDEVAEGRWVSLQEIDDIEPMFDSTRAFFRTRREGPGG